MKKVILFALIISFTASCKKEDPAPTVQYLPGCTDPTANNYNNLANYNDGSCKYNGNVTFWYNSSGTNATVHIGAYTGYVTMYYSGYDPYCGAAGCANFTLPAGTYSYSAQSTFSSWSGVVTVYGKNCTKVLLQ